MSRTISFATLFALALGGIGTAAAQAEEHAEQAWKHAQEAANAPGDSQAIREHASQALRHLETAKEANAHRPEVIEHLERGEAELRNAIEHASHYNATSAVDTATQAQTHLEKAHGATESPEATVPPPP